MQIKTQADSIIVMEEGAILMQGPPDSPEIQARLKANASEMEISN